MIQLTKFVSQDETSYLEPMALTWNFLVRAINFKYKVFYQAYAWENKESITPNKYLLPITQYITL